MKTKEELKAETKDYISGFKESISAHEFKKECLNEPEPEESQHEMWQEIIDLFASFRFSEMRERFHIQRKNP